MERGYTENGFTNYTMAKMCQWLTLSSLILEFIELKVEEIDCFKKFVDIAELNISEDIYIVLLEAKRDLHQSKHYFEGKMMMFT